MSRKWVKVFLLLAMMSGLCASVTPITTAHAQSNGRNAPGHDDSDESAVRVTLLLPLRSPLFAAAANAVRGGFLSAAQHKHGKLQINIVETGDDVQEILASYRDAATKSDIIVGPLSRSAVTALAQSSSVIKPTVALAQPDVAEPPLPPQLLFIGLSIEDEARQIALWTERDKRPGKIFTISTSIAWQRRAAKAYADQAQRIGMAVESLELSLPNGSISQSGLAQLRQRIQAEKPALLFVALDAIQTIQLRDAVGNDLPLYGTSQLNPLTLDSRLKSSAKASAAADKASLPADDRFPELNGVHLVDMPWQLEQENAIVITYQRARPASNEVRSNADIERLYALGIDAYRIANQIAQQHSGFDVDGVTGQIYVNMDRSATYFQRRETQAVYQDGVVVPLSSQR
ncbi:hypothetical protein FHW67_002883 [Herbaspirillum sp. Sphag1AN]|uniref:penicillin-binding protein activator n=1 Tax=unclassified Herbaspirillum TaxID=2624150 RepID=UPI001614077E|nr:MULTISPECIES: penicillin-binding protein activator [unclassified Herbaspirillum]MBB3213585.1 hypothetical protein [Herbaspirillum sp. Sphag1AN]MBB3246783.1 hypothetical protein [Herbaspirillum sp. Sphag64]